VNQMVCNFSDTTQAAQVIADMANRALAAGDYSGFGNLMLNELDGFRRTIDSTLWETRIVPTLRQQPFYEVALQDPFSFRSTAKPRGYAGDAVLMDFLYRSNNIGDEVVSRSGAGQSLCNYWINSPAPRSVRYRKDYFTAEIIRVTSRVSQARVFVVACGHFREGEVPQAANCFARAKIKCLDQDALSCEHVAGCFDARAVEVVNRNVSSILRMDEQEEFDLIYAAGLYDYLSDKIAIRLNAKLMTMLRAGGKLVVPNFLKKAPNRASMELLQDWWLIYRDEHEICALIEKAQETTAGLLSYFEDPFKSVGYGVFERF
jgi:extracellular factor (EF) 3-hydroxypalmitic acid methyl ester biosynthesis protein